MIDNITFLREAWLWPVVAVAVLLWGLFLWKEYAQSAYKRFVLKAVVALISVGSLALIALKPALPQERAKGTAVLLTEHYDAGQLDSLQTSQKGLSVISYLENEPLTKLRDSISKLVVLGDGVAPYDFWQLDQVSTAYLAGKKTFGLQQLTYDQEAMVGDSLSVKGAYGSATIGHTIVLEDPGGNKLDSVEISNDTHFKFTVKAMHKVSGDFLYTLKERDSLYNEVFSEPLPVVVQPQNRLNILIVNTAPSFETKYLKNFLTEKGHKVLVRSQLTKDKYKFESFNRERSVIYGFTQKNLEDFDLVVMDASSYLALSRSSRNALDTRIEQEGLGVFIQPDEVLVNSNRFDFRLKRNTKSTIQLAPWSKINLDILPASFEQNQLLEPVVKSANFSLSAYEQKGLGRIGTALWTNTYQLILDGNDEVYTHIWSKTIEAVSQRKQPTTLWKKERTISYQDEPFEFSLRTSMPEPVVLDESQSRIALKQHSNLPDRWEGVVYPKREGWNRLQLEQDSTSVFSFYVHDDNAWQDVSRFDRVAANKRRFSNLNSVENKELVLQPISRLWFLGCFLLAMTFLWVEPRLFS